MKTKFEEIMKRNPGISAELGRHDKLSLNALSQAKKGNIRFNTKFRIYLSLIELGVIRKGDYTITDLFEPIEK